MAISRHFANTTFAETVDIAYGRIQDTEVRNIFGYQESGDTTLRAAWEFSNTNYVFPTSAITMTITSANAGDNGKLLKIIGLDSNYDVITDIVTINGGGDVTTNITFFRINDVILITGTTNVGLITIQNAGKTIKYAGIRAGDGRNQASIFTVPRRKKFFLYRIDAFSSDTTADKPAIFRNFSQTTTGQQYNTARTTFIGNMNIQRRLPFKYDEKTDIQFQLATRTGSHELAVFCEGIITKA
jgi:hypothetical protein